MKKLLILTLVVVSLFSFATTAMAANVVLDPFRIEVRRENVFPVGTYKNLDSRWENIAYVTINLTDMVSSDTCQVWVGDNNGNRATYNADIRDYKTYNPSYLSGKARLTTMYYLHGQCTNSYGYVQIGGRWCP